LYKFLGRMTLLTPVLTWSTAAIATIAAIILVWSIYENWTQRLWPR